MSEKKAKKLDLRSDLELHRIKLSQFIDALKRERTTGVSPKSIKSLGVANSLHAARNPKSSQAKV